MSLSRSTVLQGIAVVLSVCVSALVVYIVFQSPTGYYAKKHAELAVVAEKTKDGYTTLDGAVAVLNDTDAPVTIINIWATWSPLSPHDFEVLAQVQERYGDTVAIKAINRKETKETARVYLDSIGAPESIEYIIDSSDQFFSHFDGFAMPETVVFDEIGNVIFHKRGTLDLRELEELLASYSTE